MKKISLISIITAFIILHTVIPHKHHEEMTISEHIKLHKKAGNPIDYLGLAFHTDLLKNLELSPQFYRRIYEQIKRTSITSAIGKSENDVSLKFNLFKLNVHPEIFNFYKGKDRKKRAPPFLRLS